MSIVNMLVCVLQVRVPARVRLDLGAASSVLEGAAYQWVDGVVLALSTEHVRVHLRHDMGTLDYRRVHV